MNFINWVVAKAVGLPTIEQNCRDSVVSVLARNSFIQPTFSHVIAERSVTNPTFRQRVYAGVGSRLGQECAFLLDVNEDIPRPQGVLLAPAELPDLAMKKNIWLSYPEHVRGFFFNFLISDIGRDLQEIS